MGNSQGQAVRAEFWLQKWIAISESVGVSKKELLEDYYFDEFLAVLDAYNEMHSVSKSADDEVEEVDAEDW